MRGSWKLMCGLCVVAIALWAGGAQAALVVYGDRAAFEAALTHAKTYTFEVSDGFPQAPTDVNPGPPPALTRWDGGRIQFSGFDGAPATVQRYAEPAIAQEYPNPVPNQQYLVGLSRVDFAFPQAAIGFDAVGVDGVPSNALITLRFADTGATRSFMFRDVTALYFFGVISDAPITSFDIDPKVPGITLPWSGIDNLAVQAIPEPGLFLMPALGSGFVLVKRKRRFRA